jgi:hypothetical protein
MANSFDFSENIAWGLGPQVFYYFNDSPIGDQLRGAFLPYFSFSIMYTRNVTAFTVDYDHRWFEEEVYTVEQWTEDHSKIRFGPSVRAAVGATHMLSKRVGLFGELAYQADWLRTEFEGYLTYQVEDTDYTYGDTITILFGLNVFIY